MTNKVLQEVLERVGTWSEDRQENAARVLLEMEEQETQRSHLTDQQVEEVARRLANLGRKFVSFDDVRQAFQNRRA